MTIPNVLRFPERAKLPGRISPSSASFLLAGGCRLRACSGKAFPPGLDRLPSGVEAERGILIHAAIDATARGGFPSTVSGNWCALERLETERRTAGRVFDLVAADRSDLWARTPGRSHWNPLSEVFGEMAWRELRREAVRRALPYLSLSPSQPRSAACSPTPRDDSGAKYVPLEPGEVRTEAWLSSERWPLHGQVDHLELAGDRTLTIRDHKSGLVKHEDKVNPAYELQLQLYALMARELQRLGDVDVELWLDGAEGATPVDGSRAALKRAEKVLADAVESVPLGKEVRPAELATPGERQCARCALRHACEPYQRWVEATWREAAGDEWFPLPLDTWGEIADVQALADGVRLSLRAADGIVRQVSRLRPNWLSAGLAIGQRFLFFDLATADGRFRGVYRHPRRFHEWDSEPERRAWSLSVFCSAGA